ncbi:MAG TPA: hypothetical protein DEQ14_10930 [Treponema sp.]|nr:hypothetical protein [Treponema sp.]
MAQGLERGMAQGLEKGHREGHREGQQDKAAEIARNLKAGGIFPDAIAQFTGLTPEEIARL